MSNSIIPTCFLWKAQTDKTVMLSINWTLKKQMFRKLKFVYLFKIYLYEEFMKNCRIERKCDFSIKPVCSFLHDFHFSIIFK